MSPAGGGARARRVCTATTGFFVLARCERPARQGCARCHRSICSRHAMVLPADPAAVCPECYAGARGLVDDVDDPAWAISFRRSYYWDASTSTGDDTWWSTFDDLDRSAFDEPAVEDLDGDGIADDAYDDGDGDDGFDADS